MIVNIEIRTSKIFKLASFTFRVTECWQMESLERRDIKMIFHMKNPGLQMCKESKNKSMVCVHFFVYFDSE